MLQMKLAVCQIALGTGLLFTAAAVAHAGYRIERIASGLNQPTYVTQAPGDPANIIYFAERTSNTNIMAILAML